MLFPSADLKADFRARCLGAHLGQQHFGKLFGTASRLNRFSVVPCVYCRSLLQRTMGLRPYFVVVPVVDSMVRCQRSDARFVARCLYPAGRYCHKKKNSLVTQRFAPVPTGIAFVGEATLEPQLRLRARLRTSKDSTSVGTPPGLSAFVGYLISGITV